MVNRSDELYLKALQNTFYRLNQVYVHLLTLVNPVANKRDIQVLLHELETQMAMVQTDILRVTYTLQVLKNRRI